MHRETIITANEIIKLIDDNKTAIELLEKLTTDDCHLFTGDFMKAGIYFEPWEIRLIIHNKKQRIAALEKELEEL